MQETQGWPKYWDCVVIPRWDVSCASLQSSESVKEEERMEELDKGREVMRLSSGHNVAATVMNSQQLRLPLKGLHKAGPVHIQSWLRLVCLYLSWRTIGCWWMLGKKSHCLRCVTTDKLSMPLCRVAYPCPHGQPWMNSVGHKQKDVTVEKRLVG